MSMQIERRRHSRMELNIPITVRTSDGLRVEGRLQNLSSGGVSVVLRDTGPILADEAVEIDLQLSRPGELAAVTSTEPGIVRYRDARTVGIQFNRLRMGRVA